MIKFRLEAVLMIRKSAKNPDLHSAILNTWRRPVFKSSYVPAALNKFLKREEGNFVKILMLNFEVHWTGLSNTQW